MKKKGNNKATKQQRNVKKESKGDENPTIKPNGDADYIDDDGPGSRLVSPLSSLFSHKVKAPLSTTLLNIVSPDEWRSNCSTHLMIVMVHIFFSFFSTTGGRRMGGRRKETERRREMTGKPEQSAATKSRQSAAPESPPR